MGDCQRKGRSAVTGWLAERHAQIRSPSGETTEGWSQHDANIPNVYGDVKDAEDVPNDTRSRHQPGVDGPTDDTSERVPSRRVEPVPEFL
jgi:hypothetical protein